MVLIKTDVIENKENSQLHLNIKVSATSQIILKIKRWVWRFKFTVLQKIFRSTLVWLNFYMVLFQLGITLVWHWQDVKAKAVFWEMFYKLKILNFGILKYNSVVFFEFGWLIFNIVFMYMAFRISERYLFGLFPFLVFSLFLFNLIWLKILILNQALL